jgi:uncharacterized oxidoreductase
MDLSNNTVFVTGATSGIGRGLAEAFHRLGNTVIISGRRRALLDEVTAANPGMVGIELDIADPASIARTAERLVAEFPTLNVLVNNAGVMPFGDPSKPLDDAASRSVVDTNLLGPIRMTSALIEHLKAQPKATIIHNTSVLAFVPIAANAVYSATKAALHSFTLSQRFMLRDTNVSVVEIAPPWVNTDLIRKSDDPRAMPLDTYVELTMDGLGTDKEELIVDGIRAFRDNPGSNEHAVVNAFNAEMIANPVPV